LCWQTVEQQFNAALAGALAVIGQHTNIQIPLLSAKIILKL
jgi:hypothetical protein